MPRRQQQQKDDSVTCHDAILSGDVFGLMMTKCEQRDEGDRLNTDRH